MKFWKVGLIFAVVTFLVVPLLVILGLGMFTGSTGPISACYTDAYDAEAAVYTSEPSQNGPLKVDGVPITNEQRKNAAIIAGVARSEGMPASAGVIGVATAIVESHLENLPYGYPGSSSLGLFQQIEAWGPVRVRMNPRLSAQMFFTGGRAGQRGLEDIPNWESLPPGVAAQEVQQSAYPDKYAEHIAEATAIVQSFNGGETISTTELVDAACEDMFDPLEIAIRAALSRQGDEYDWEDDSGSGLVSWAFGEADITLPDALDDLGAYRGDQFEGVKAQSIPGSAIQGPGDLRRGDLVFWSDDGDDTTDNVGIELGPGTPGTEFRVATYNIKTGLGWQQRLARAKELIRTMELDVVGFQEVERDYLFNGMSSASFLGRDYAIYPESTYRPHLNGLNGRSIVYSTKRFEFVKADEITFSRMGSERPQPARAPVIWLQDRATGQQVIVVNTHNPAYKRFAKERYLAARTYAQKISELKQTGLPVVFTGDFNSSYWVRRDVPNTTYQNDRANLDYCQLTADGLMRNARDVVDGLNGYCPRRESDGGHSVDHIYVTPDLNVDRFGRIDNTLSDHAALYADVRLPAETRSSPAGSFVIATYNVLGASHSDSGGNKAYEPDSGPRMDKAIKVIQQNGFDVIGLQEFEQKQRTMFLSRTNGAYGIYPSSAVYRGDRTSVNSIVWRSDRFELVRGFERPFVYFGGNENALPVVLLRDKETGDEFYVTNTHDPANTRRWKDQERFRIENARRHRAFVAGLRDEGLPVFLVGDLNSTFKVRPGKDRAGRDELPYCILTEGGVLHNAYDVLRGRNTSACPTTDTAGSIDHVYVTPGVNVSNWDIIRSDDAKFASDHYPVSAVVSTGGGAIGAVGGRHVVGLRKGIVATSDVHERRIVKVLRLTFTEPIGNDIIPIGDGEDGTWSPPLRKGTYSLPSTSAGSYGWRIHPVRGDQDFHNGIDLSASVGVPVYSVGGGTVVRASYDSCWGNLVIVDHGDTLSMYTHLGSYAPVFVGMPVKAGSPIGTVGNTGVCTTGPHLHFTVGTSLEMTFGNEAGSLDPVLYLRARGITL